MPVLQQHRLAKLRTKLNSLSHFIYVHLRYFSIVNVSKKPHKCHVELCTYSSRCVAKLVIEVCSYRDGNVQVLGNIRCISFMDIYYVTSLFAIKTFEVLARKREWKRPRHRWQNSLKLALEGTGNEGVDRIHLAENRDQ